MTVFDVVRLLRANIGLLVFSVVAGLALGYLYTSRLPVLYSSDASGYVVAGSAGSVGDSFAGSTLASQKASYYVALIGSRAVAERVAADLQKTNPGAPLPGLSASVALGAPILKVTAISSKPEIAQLGAAAGVKAVAEVADALEKGQAVNDPTKKPTGDSIIKLLPIDDAFLPGAPFTPNFKTNLLAGGFVGFVVGFILSILRRQVDRRLRHSEDAEKLTGASVLGVVPLVKELSGRDRGAAGELGAAAESLRQLRTNLRFVDIDHPPRCIVVTSATPGEGKSTIAANVARMVAASGVKTVLIDADLRRPMQARIFGADSDVGLTQVLLGDVPFAEALQPAGEENLFLMPAGRIPPNPSELLGSQKMAALMREMSEEYFVFLDAPPLLPVTDAGLLTAMVDGAILVFHTGKTYKEQAELCARVLERVGGRLLGTVLNMAPRRGLGSVYYGYGYGYYRSHYYYYRSEGKRTLLRRKSGTRGERSTTRNSRRDQAVRKTTRRRRSSVD